ncbi:UNVERIFIED_CONTAM: NitT/TauT family transport system ATP-binding protein [Acetivibrio alkalicellulosi]
MLEISNLYKSFGNLKVIDNLNISFSSNKIHCIFGPSGCGKSTLVNIIAGTMDYDKGSINGMVGKRISYVFQEDRLLPWATIDENMMFVLESGFEKSRGQQTIDKYLSLVDLLKFKNHYPEELSGGMKQRVSIARAFAFRGDILVMDEPFKGLHLEIKKDIMDYILKEWNKDDKIIFFITHDMEEALYLSDYIYIFNGPPLKLKRKIDIDIPHLEREESKVKLRAKVNDYI